MKHEQQGTPEPVVGVIGGSGLYEIDGLEEVKEVRISTPFGDPSDAFVTGILDGVRMAFLPRHGRGHLICPSGVNYRANIWGMKELGVNRIISVSAVGSMREGIVPGDFVVIDQFIDRTRHRPDTFFSEPGLAVHVMFADPTCEDLRGALRAGIAEIGVKVHDGGTYLNMEGPQFSTRAESNLYRSWGVDVIGMTNVQEAKLAREAEICFATVAMVSDFDCWHEEHDDVTVEGILEIMGRNAAHALRMIPATLPHLKRDRACPCKDALRYAIITDPQQIPADVRARLGLLIGQYVPD
jgi:5'-methylthioadenosine phosphorylase